MASSDFLPRVTGNRSLALFSVHLGAYSTAGEAQEKPQAAIVPIGRYEQMR